MSAVFSASASVEACCEASSVLLDGVAMAARMIEETNGPYQDGGVGGQGRGYKGMWSVLLNRDRWLASDHRGRVRQSTRRSEENDTESD